MSEKKANRTTEKKEEEICVAVIGSAGRGEDEIRMTDKLFQQMIVRVNDQIKKVWKLDPFKIHLVSGGSSWCDHVAVHLCLKYGYKACTLYLPCKFKEDQKFDTQSRYGYVLNQLHKSFSKKAKIDSLHDIHEACTKKGMRLNETSSGFYERNEKVASKAQYVVAMTWGNGKVPKDGGTKHTWNLCTQAKTKLHIPLSSLGQQVIKSTISS